MEIAAEYDKNSASRILKLSGRIDEWQSPAPLIIYMKCKLHSSHLTPEYCLSQRTYSYIECLRNCNGKRIDEDEDEYRGASTNLTQQSCGDER